MNRKEYSLVSRRSTDFGVEVSSIIDSFSRFVDSFSRFVDGMKEMNGSLDSILAAMGTTA